MSINLLKLIMYIILPTDRANHLEKEKGGFCYVRRSVATENIFITPSMFFPSKEKTIFMTALSGLCCIVVNVCPWDQKEGLKVDPLN